MKSLFCFAHASGCERRRGIANCKMKIANCKVGGTGFMNRIENEEEDEDEND
jgi:hypothetical protein